MEILIDILKVVAEGNEKPTHVMYRANLSWTRLKEQLDFLLRQEMLAEIETESGAIYKLTLKGKETLEYFRKIEVQLSGKKQVMPTEVYATYR